MREEIEQLRTQLAGCSVAALGGGEEAKRDSYGWSPAYQDVLDLRKKYEKLLKKEVSRGCLRKKNVNI